MVGSHSAGLESQSVAGPVRLQDTPLPAVASHPVAVLESRCTAVAMAAAAALHIRLLHSSAAAVPGKTAAVDHIAADPDGSSALRPSTTTIRKTLLRIYAAIEQQKVALRSRGVDPRIEATRALGGLALASESLVRHSLDVLTKV